MRTEVIKADTIDAAVKRILNELGADTRRSSNRENAIYFDGWNGLGASAVLQAVAKLLAVSSELSTTPAGLEFEKILHIDCSKWESRRAMQREIAEQLKLPNWVMEMFDKQDEEDDFNGLDEGSRSEIAEVFTEIYQTVHNRRFLLILHNGSNEEIDIFKFGLSLYEYTNSKMLWTFQGKFRLDPKMIDNVKKSRITDVLLSASRDERDPHDLWSYLVSHEAEQVSCNKHGEGIIDPAIAADCVLYMLKQCSIGYHTVDYDWAIHTSNYWVCDGIISLTDTDRAWQVGDVLQHEVLLSSDMDNRLNNDESRVMTFSSHLARPTERMPYWISTTPSTSGFVVSPSGVIPENMFQHSHMLNVLKLSRCTFSFSSPPFLGCHSLRFLWLDHCKDLLARSTTDYHHTDADKQTKELENITATSWECFQSLWVLDVRYTDWDQILSARVMDLMTQLKELNVIGAKNWDMSVLQGHDIRKLRVIKSTCYFNNNVFSQMESLELLDFSGNIIRQGMRSLCGPASNTSLKTVTINGCDGLNIITLRGCKELKNFFLKGFIGKLDLLDFSGTGLETLNLGGVLDGSIKQLFLLGCEKLRAILWPKTFKEYVWTGVLRINTTSTSTSADRVEALHVHPHVDPSIQQQIKDAWQISVTDSRILRSLSHVRNYLARAFLHIDIYSAATHGSNVQGTSNNHTSAIMGSKYRDVLKDGLVATSMMWDSPKLISGWHPVLERLPYYSVACAIKVIMHGRGNKLLEDAPGASTSALLLPDFICEEATSMHVYDNSAIISITATPKGPEWKSLRWCRLDRCPKLNRVFRDSVEGSFYHLETFWASELLTACYLWDMPYYFQKLNFLHLDHCPRLVHVLEFEMWTSRALSKLETLEIMYCGDLKEVFPLNPRLREMDKVLVFPTLWRIHLHELPSLQRICGRRMYAPNLKTIKIRGCWSLRRLPAVGFNTKPPKVDCEKEWWDNLEWDGLEENHHPSLYEPSHSMYYKSQLPRVSVLR